METSSSPARYPRRRITAACLAIFLGWLGIHKFYLGQNLWGILYLLFVGTGIPFIAGIIEGVVLLLMSDAHFDEIHNKPKLMEKKHPRLTAASLAFFVGGFGVHKFYLRQTIAGLIYLSATLFGTYLSLRALEASGLMQKLTHLDSMEALQFLSGLDRMNIEGMFWPSILMLIPALGGILDGIMILSTPKEKFEKEYGLTEKE